MDIKTAARSVAARLPLDAPPGKAPEGSVFYPSVDGVVHNACVSPGLLFDDSETLYVRRPSPPDDPHGAPAVLYAFLGSMLLGSP